MLDEQSKNKDLSGKNYIVTGANSGVGLETTRQLIKQGANVIMACRRVDAARKAADSFSGLKGSYDIMELELADLDSIRDFVKNFQAKYDRLDGLDNNAGLVVNGNEAKKTRQGFEYTIGVNYLGHFLLTELLLDMLKKSAPSRIVMFSSVIHAGSEKSRPDVNLDDINSEKRKYNAMEVYGDAKVATALYALELADRLKGTGVTTASVHPGWAMTNFGNDTAAMRFFNKLSGVLMRSMRVTSEVGAQTALHCLISDDAPNHSGSFFSQSEATYSDLECRPGGWPMESPNPNAKNLVKAKQMVELSYKLVGLKQD